MPRLSFQLCASSIVLLTATFACSVVRAQDSPIHPITSLPKAPTNPSQPSPFATGAPSSATVPATPTDSPAPPTAAPPSVTAPPAADPATAPAPVFTPDPALQASMPTPQAAPPAPRLQRNTIRPFSTAAISVNFGIGGIGGQIAVPLSQTLNLRAGGDFFNYGYNETDNGLQYSGTLKFSSVNLNVDWFPFHGGFHISPGITLYNGNNLNAALLAPGGQTFSLNDVNYLSSTTDPVHGSASLAFGNRTAPQLTMGFGNMIPRSGRHFSVPIDIGFEYIGAPLIQLQLAGTACTGTGVLQGCVNAATDPNVQANRAQEQNELNADINGLRFYPVVRLGLAYKF